MRIIHIVLGKANPERMNGVNKVAFHLAKTQFEMGHDARIWGIANSLEHNYPPRNFPTELFRQLSNKLHLDPTLVDAVRSLSKYDSICHIHGSFIPEFYHLTKLLRRQRIGYVYTPHGSLTEAAMKQGKWRKKIYFSLFERQLITHAKAVQLLGQQEFTFIDKLMSVPQKVLIPNGMDFSEIPDLPVKKRAPYPIFNFCGRLDIFQKGLDFMLEGFAQFLAEGHDGRLELIGDGKDKKAMEKMVNSLGITDKVTFHGSKFGDEKYHLMARGDVFLHTSRNEGFPMAVLEAATLGLPCLTSEPTNINQYIRRYGAGFPLEENHDAFSVCEALKESEVAFQKGQLEAIGNQAKRMVKEEFDWQNICQKLVEIYAAKKVHELAVA